MEDCDRNKSNRNNSRHNINNNWDPILQFNSGKPLSLSETRTWIFLFLFFGLLLSVS